MISVNMELNPEQHPACIMSRIHTVAIEIVIWSYWCCQRQIRYTWTALQHMPKANRRSDIINKISNHQRNSPSFYLFCDQVRYFVDMTISRLYLGKSCQIDALKSISTYDTALVVSISRGPTCTKLVRMWNRLISRIDVGVYHTKNSADAGYPSLKFEQNKGLWALFYCCFGY